MTGYSREESRNVMTLFKCVVSTVHTLGSTCKPSTGVGVAWRSL